MEGLAPHEYRTLAGPVNGEYKEKGSRFIAYARKVYTEDEARDFLEEVKKEHHKARHHCSAWRVGGLEKIERANDDGEPSSTAGKPILGQIHSFELENVAIIVVRYFGGIKLGASGLIHAYREAAKEALQGAEIVVEEILRDVRLDLDYNCAHFLLDSAKKRGIPIREMEYTDRARIVIALPPGAVDDILLVLKSETLQMPVEMAAETDSPAWEVTILGLS